MVKEPVQERENAVKKRRKGGSSSTSTSPAKVPERDIYKSVIEFEETEASARDPENDMALFCKTCDDIRKLMEEIAKLKARNTGVNNEQILAEISEKRIQASLLFVVLKKLNRLEKFRTKTSRDTLNREKQQVDSYHLQLQNLLYEILHLKKEVTKCLQFKSKDEEIDLVPVEEFYKEAPELLSRPNVTQNDSHQLKLARLEWELEQRKQLAVLCQKLQAEKETVAKEIQSKRERLENLTPRLKSILEVTKPLQDYLGLPLDKIRRQHQAAYHLPKPLYVLYVQADAYREACDPLLTVAVSGDEEEARSLKQSLDDSAAADESDSDQEDCGDRQKRHHRKLSRTDRLEERKKRLLLRHPLTVDITIKLQDGNSLLLSFHYLVHLHVVTVKTRITLVQAVHGISAGDLIAPHNILTALFPHDLGLDSPNVANHYQLQSVGLEDFASYIPELGIPYIWAQRVAGLDFMGARAIEIMGNAQESNKESSVVEPQTSVSQASVESVMRAIRQRLKARIALCRQVQALEAGLVSVPHALRGNFPAKICTSLFSWQLISWDDFCHTAHTQALVQAQAVNRGDSFYKAVLTRGSAKLVALIGVKCDYPRTPTVFCLQLNWHGEHDAGNNDAIRDMERELNVYWMELVGGVGWGNTLLAAQLLQLMACLDVFLESAGSTGISPLEFPRDKIFFRPVRGRTRSRPYKYLRVGGGIFTHR
ncbi:THO complex subunit 5-like protein [Cryptotermes secundus]|uniref:THO complex subunit 5-like protein n=1 Tax=Cryptotermes secundus TaxID=105785 RepID=A0A2J7RRE6_9NEOP|nr:THO complex subunit 5 homolog [Cryptotermes secundus]PNF43385.1 THO complex subunit 5-like protein [Cryptotermes secundus]